ncbi:MAG: hypothetical protein ACLRFI_03090 [Alphaproteobacteria bacterium]
MLNGFKVWSSDKIWRHILTELGANVPEKPGVLDVNLDDFNLTKSIDLIDLKSLILHATENTNVMHNIFGDKIPVLPQIQNNILICLYKTGGISAEQLKQELGYSPDITTHTIDTAIYNLRKLYGSKFIINDNGVYKLGGI